jgi:hypothetical protein
MKGFNEWQGSLSAKSVVETDYFPYLRTDKGSLVFTIAPNGHVFGHRVEVGTKRDIELEIFGLFGGGYTLKRKNGFSMPSWSYERELTTGQKKTIKRIVGQKDSLSNILGSMVLDYNHASSLRENYSGPSFSESSWRLERYQYQDQEDIYRPAIVDCSIQNPHQRLSNSGLFCIEYKDADFTFEVSSGTCFSAGGVASDKVLWSKVGEQYKFGFSPLPISALTDVYKNGYRFFEPGQEKDFPHYVISAVRAEDKKFYVDHFPACAEKKMISSEKVVLYDIMNMFDVFEIDDALLFLEEKRLSENDSELYWTVVVSKNKIFQEHRRMKSNNPNI